MNSLHIIFNLILAYILTELKRSNKSRMHDHGTFDLQNGAESLRRSQVH